MALLQFIRTLAFDNGAGSRTIVSPANPLPVTGVSGGGSSAAADIVSGVKAVAAAATPEALVASSTPCLWVYVESPDTDIPPGPLIAANSGNVWVGADNGPVHKLAPGEGMGFDVADVQKLVVRVASDGDGVAFTYGVGA